MNEGLTKIFVPCDYLHALETPYEEVYVFQLTRFVFVQITCWTDISKKKLSSQSFYSDKSAFGTSARREIVKKASILNSKYELIRLFYFQVSHVSSHGKD